MQDNRNNINKIRRFFIVGLLIAMVTGLAYQTFLTGRLAATLVRNKVWDNRTRTSLSRGADVAYGQSYMHFIDTMLENVPEGADIYIISMRDRPEYSSKAFLQYFMLPRIIRYCATEEDPLSCIEETGSEDTYFWIDRIPVDLEAAFQLGYQAIPVNEDQYLLLPVD